MNEMPNLPDVPCKCFDEADDCGCVCGESERVLRHVMRMQIKLTPEQRAWALCEIKQVEGYDLADYVGREDHEIAHGVLNAWTDYARDKGLL